MDDEIKITKEALQDNHIMRDIIFRKLIEMAEKSEIECITVTPSEVKNDNHD